MNIGAKGERSASSIVLRWTIHVLLRTMLVGLVLLAFAYIADSAVFVLRGKPQGQITVSRYMAAPLKDDKTEYYFESSGPVACARALFPQAGLSTCWQLRRHPIVSENP